MLSPAAVAAIEEGFALKREAVRLLDLIAAEFASDPISTQCFDRKAIVEPAIRVSTRLRAIERGAP